MPVSAVLTSTTALLPSSAAVVARIPCGAALTAAFAFSPLWRKKDPEQGRVLTLALFAVLAFLPSSWASYTLRVYRDNIFPALCLYFFAGMAGMALRAVQEKPAPLWPWLAAAGAGTVTYDAEGGDRR